MKEHLRQYLQEGRDALLGKLDGLPEYDARRPLTPTGTNLLGLIKHLAGIEQDYFGLTFGRAPAEPLAPWAGEDGNGDMWATADESRAMIVEAYRRAWALADATVEALPLDAPGHVPWWTTRGGEVTLHRILVHVIAETHRHAGHADIVRELVDGEVGMRRPGDNLPEGDAAWWAANRARVQAAAEATGR